MNPRLVKFVVELQNCNSVEEKQKYIHFVDGKKDTFLNIYKNAKVTIPVSKD